MSETYSRRNTLYNLTVAASSELNWALTRQIRLTLTGNVTVSRMLGGVEGEELRLFAVQDSTGSRTITWPANVTWVGGTAPTLSTTADAIDVLTFWKIGENYRGSLVGTGSGDVTKVGTPANDQVGVWTGSGTLEGDAALTFDTVNDRLAIGASGKLAFGAVDILSDAAGVTTLANVDALDATTEATIEAAIDTLANLTSIQGRTVTLAGAVADAVWGWDASANQYVNLSSADARAAIGITTDGAATAADVNTGTSTTLAVTPDALAGSNLGAKPLNLTAIDYTTAVTTGDGKAYFLVPVELAGMNLVRAHAAHITPNGTSGTTTIQVARVRAGVAADMLAVANPLTIDFNERDSSTAAAAAVINAANDDIAAHDLIRIDVDAIPAGTAPSGLLVALTFQLP